MNKGKQQVNEQKQDGQIQMQRSSIAKLFLSRLAVPFAAKVTLPSFTLTKMEGGQTLSAESATRKSVLNAGTQEAGLTDGLHAPTNMASRNNFSLICTTNKRENVPYVGMSQQLKEVCMSIIAMQLKKFGGFFATDATLVLGLSKRTPRFFLKQSVI